MKGQAAPGKLHKGGGTARCSFCCDTNIVRRVGDLRCCPRHSDLVDVAADNNAEVLASRRARYAHIIPPSPQI